MKFDKALAIRVLGEFSATAMLMCLLPMALVRSTIFPSSLLQCAIGSGLSVGICIQCFGCVSGAHINPAVSLANYILGYMSITLLGLYLLAQVLGCLVGYALFVAMLPWEYVQESPALTVPHPVIGDGQLFGIEFIITSTLVLFCCSIWDQRNAAHTEAAPLKFANLICLLVLFGGNQTGASINPIRSLAPAIFHNTYTKIWIYFLSHAASAVSMACAWRFLFGVSEGDGASTATSV